MTEIITTNGLLSNPDAMLPSWLDILCFIIYIYSKQVEEIHKGFLESKWMKREEHKDPLGTTNKFTKFRYSVFLSNNRPYKVSKLSFSFSYQMFNWKKKYFILLEV